MKAGKVIGRVVATHKDKSLEGKKILLLKPMTWEEIDEAVNNGNDNAGDNNHASPVDGKHLRLNTIQSNDFI